MERIERYIHIATSLAIKTFKGGKFNPTIFGYDDIRASALYGLVVADKKYTSEEEVGCKFSTFAEKRIQWQFFDDFRSLLPGKRLHRNRGRPTLTSFDERDFAREDSICEDKVYLAQTNLMLIQEMNKLLIKKEIVVISLMFFGCMTQTDVAKHIKKSKARVNVLYKSGIRKLKESKCLYNLYKGN